MNLIHIFVPCWLKETVLKMKLSSKEKYLAEIYARHFYKVRYFAFHYLGDEEQARDVAQEVFIRIWDSEEKIDRDRDVLPYLITITRNICMNILKKRDVRRRYDDYTKRNFMDDINSEALGELTVSALYSEEVSKLFEASLQEMTPSVKETFLLNRIRGHKYKEIADIQNISVKTVEWRVAGAIRILQKKFKDYLPFFLSFLFP